MHNVFYTNVKFCLQSTIKLDSLKSSKSQQLSFYFPIFLSTFVSQHSTSQVNNNSKKKLKKDSPFCCTWCICNAYFHILCLPVWMCIGNWCDSSVDFCLPSGEISKEKDPKLLWIYWVGNDEFSFNFPPFSFKNPIWKF